MGHGPGGEASGATIAASVDIGTNTVRLLAVELGAGGKLRRLRDEGRITGLGAALTPTGELAGPAVDDTLSAVAEYCALARALGAQPLVVYATAAVRRAKNAAGFLREAAQRAGAPVRVLSGEEEARLSYLGAAFGREATSGALVVADVGGGSTEISWGAGREFRGGTSLALGSRTLAAECGGWDARGRLPARAAEQALFRARAALAEARKAQWPPRCAELLATGGTMAALAAIALGLGRYDPERIHGFALPRERLEALAERLARATLAERRKICHIEPERAEVIVHGALIFLALLDELGARAGVADVNGVRLGAILEALSAGEGKGRS